VPRFNGPPGGNIEDRRVYTGPGQEQLANRLATMGGFEPAVVRRGARLFPEGHDPWRHRGVTPEVSAIQQGRAPAKPLQFAGTDNMAPKYNPGDFVDGYEFTGGDYKDRANWQDWGPGSKKLPDGSVVRYGPRGGMTVLKQAGQAGGAGDLREFEINAAGRATLMDQGQTDYEAAVREGYNPGDPRNVIARSIEGTGVGNFFADVIRDNPAEKARAAELQFVDGALRTTTGANAPEPEVVRANRAYFRQPGESAAVEPDRALVRQRFRQQAIRAAGAAYLNPESVPGYSKKNPIVLTPENHQSIPQGAYFRGPDGKVYRQQPGAGPAGGERYSAARTQGKGWKILGVE
jgi:hypothetical protein